MSQQLSIFDSEVSLPNETIDRRGQTLLGFDGRYSRIHAQLRLLLQAGDLARWNQRFHNGRLTLADLAAEQYPLVIFHGDVGTGKTAMAECMASRIVRDARADDSILFKLSNRVRGKGLVGEMGSLLAEAFARVGQAAGKHRRAILIIDEGDSLGASRAQDHSHHEDKVAVNTLIQGIDDLRQYGGRVVVFFCTNRLSILDPAIRRRASIVEEFRRPSDTERRELFATDLAGLSLSPGHIEKLVQATGPKEGGPGWTYSDIRMRLYPAALAQVFPDSALTFDKLLSEALRLRPSPAMVDA